MEEPLVTLASFDWLWQADLVQCRLEASGIQTFVPDQYTNSLCWHYGKLLGGVRVQVCAEDLEDARAILDEEPLPAGEPILTAHEKRTERARAAAAFGILQEPLELYALWLLLPVFLWKEPMTALERRNILSALVVIGLLGTLFGLTLPIWLHGVFHLPIRR